MPCQDFVLNMLYQGTYDNFAIFCSDKGLYCEIAELIWLGEIFCLLLSLLITSLSTPVSIILSIFI